MRASRAADIDGVDGTGNPHDEPSGDQPQDQLTVVTAGRIATRTSTADLLSLATAGPLKINALLAGFKITFGILIRGRCPSRDTTL